MATQLDIFQPEIKKICPKNPEVSFQALDINPAYSLVVQKLGNNDLGVISKSSPSFKPIPNAAPKNVWNLYFFEPGPTKKQLVLRYSDNQDTKSSIWISTIDGSKQQHVITIDKSQTVEFVSDEEIIIVGVPEKKIKEYTGQVNYEDRVPLKSINIMTGVSNTLTPLPDQAIYVFYFTKENHSYAVYKVKIPSNGEFAYFLYDYTDDTTTPVFQWLNGIEGWHYLNAGVVRRGNGLFATMLDRAYGFDYAIDLPFEQIFEPKSYDEMMKGVALPGGYNENLLTVYDYYSTEGAFMVSRFKGDDRDQRPFYIFDYQKKILKDYCLTLYNPGEFSVSPDQRFMVMIKFEPAKINGIQDLKRTGILVVDIQTGQFASLDGYSEGHWIIGDNPK